MPLRIFQYEDPRKANDPRDEGTRWIAAPTEAKAAKFAALSGWEQISRGTAEVHEHNPARAILATSADYRAFGCDVVIPE